MRFLRLPRRAPWLRILPALLAAPFALAHASAADTPLRLDVAEQARFVCTADVSQNRLACEALVPGGAAAFALRLDGRQTASNLGLWSPSVAVHSLETGGHGLADVSVRVLGAPQTTRGAGAVRVTGPVLASYAGTLAPGGATTAQPWQFAVDPGVDAFSVQVAVVGAAVISPLTLSTTPKAIGLPGDVDASAPVLRTARGIRLPMQEVGTWSSSDPTVATVDADGRVTRVGVGSSVIAYTVGGRAVQQTTVQVCPTLAVGEVYHFSEAQAASFCVAGLSATSEYTLVASNQSRYLTSTGFRTTTVTASGIESVTGPPSPVAGRGGDIMAADAAENDSGEGDDLRPRPTDLPRMAGASRSAAFPNRDGAAIGDLMTFNVGFSCNATPDLRTGRVKAMNSRVIVVEDVNNPVYIPNATTPTAAFTPDNLVLWLDTIGWPSVVTEAGRPSDVDNNGQVILFLTRAVNELSPPASSAVTFGFMLPSDLIDPAACPGSNGGEIVYMLVPDPTGVVNSNVRTEPFVAGNASRTMGMELMRLVLHGKRLHTLGSGTPEEPWLESALLGMAEDLMFYNQSVGLAPRTNIITSHLTTGPSATRRVAAFNAYINNGFGRLRPFLQRPDSSGAMRGFNSLAARGSGWAFLRYALDRVGGPDSLVLQKLAGGQVETGRENLRLALGLASVDELEQWYRDFLVSLYTDDAVAGVTARYTLPSWNYRNLHTTLYGSYQLVPRLLSNGTPTTLSMRGGGSAVYYRLGVAADGSASVTTSFSGGVIDTPVRFSLVRTK